jgi:3-methyladenine DNA glycosylase Tag
MSYAATKELAYRNQNGLEVTLLWDPRSNEVSVEVVDHLDDSGFCLPIAGHLALDAFQHPYAYVQSHENGCDRVPQATRAE